MGINYIASFIYQDVICWRCGRQGHISSECYARTDVYGNYI